MDRKEGQRVRDHGGNLDAAIARYGGEAADWVDLSTGINRVPYPLPPIPAGAWARLPTLADCDRLTAVARAAYRTEAAVVPLAGAQAAIQLMPRLRVAGRARILAPTYNEHRAALESEGWTVEEVSTFDALAGAELAVVVNPNNPDGRLYAPQQIAGLSAHVGLLVVDESFIDPVPEQSSAPHAGQPSLVVLRSFGKFYGLAGLRLGFAIGNQGDIARLRDLAGPWAVSGPAIEIGVAALSNAAWAAETRRRLRADAARLDHLASRAGWGLVGGTALFRLYRSAGAVAAQARLAQSRIWSRIFPWSDDWIRLGLPGRDTEWARLANVLEG